MNAKPNCKAAWDDIDCNCVRMQNDPCYSANITYCKLSNISMVAQSLCEMLTWVQTLVLRPKKKKIPLAVLAILWLGHMPAQVTVLRRPFGPEGA